MYLVSAKEMLQEAERGRYAVGHFNLNNMEWLMNIGSMTEDACKDCWALSHCRICAAEIDYKEDQDGFTKEQNLTACEKSRRAVMGDLYEMCVLHEFGYRLNEERIIL